jgi:hypothetical protein
MNIHGTCLALPIRPDSRGSLAVVSDPTAGLEQEIISLIETRRGERVLVPDYGMPDSAFSVKGAGAMKAIGYLLGQQVAKYVPGVERVRVTEIESSEHRAVLHIEWRERGGNVPHNLVYPTRRLADL